MVNSSLQCENTEQHIACSRYAPKKGRKLSRPQVWKAAWRECGAWHPIFDGREALRGRAERRFGGEARGALKELREARPELWRAPFPVNWWGGSATRNRYLLFQLIYGRGVNLWILEFFGQWNPNSWPFNQRSHGCSRPPVVAKSRGRERTHWRTIPQ